MAAVFGPSQDGESENSRNASDGSFALIGEGPFFWLLFFGLAKKSDPLARGERKPLIFVPKRQNFKVNTFALKRESLSFAGPKESNQRKRPPRTRQTCRRKVTRDFSTGHPCPVEKRPASMPAALRVSWLSWLSTEDRGSKAAGSAPGRPRLEGRTGGRTVA